FSSTTDWVPLANLTQVFAGDVSSYVPLANNWMEIPLTTPFNYNNTDNLVIAVDENTSGYASMSWGAFTSGTNTGIYYYSDSVNPDPATPPTATSRTADINRIQLVFPNSSAPLAPTLLSPSNGGWAMIGDILSWTPTSGAGDATTYDVYFGTSTNPPLVSSNQAATTYTPTLIAGTTYYWKVVARNELGDSPASAIWSFKTPTATQLAESFENTSFPPGGWANPGTWSRSTSYAKHGTASAYKYGSSSSQYILSTPKVTITSTSTLNFWSLCSSTSGILQIVYSPDRTTWTQIGSDITYAATYTMYNTVVDLSSLAGNNYYLGVRTGGQSYTSYYVDLVIGPEITPEAPGAPTLSTPADLATNVNELTTFTWTAPTTGGAPTGYKLYCDTSNPPTTLKADLNALTYTLTTSLAYNTTYYWTVSAYNGTGEGPTATVRSFTTRANPTISTFPYTAGNFENGGALPINWVASEGVAGASYHWNVSTGAASHGPSAPHSGTYFGWLYCYWANSTYNPYYLTTPPIALDATAKRLTYWYWIGTDTYTNPLFVEISTDNQATWTTLYTHSNASNTLAWYQNTISLETYASQTVYLRFKGMSNYGSGMTDLGLDDIIVEDIPAAPIISCTPTSWDFGQVLVNTTKTKEFTISNIGGGTLNVSSIAVAGAYYTLLTNPAPVNLTAGQSATFTVQYAPTAVGTHNGAVTITDNRGTTTVDLSAVCYDPTISTFPWVEDFGTTTNFPPLNWSRLTGLYPSETPAT
ncbi:MAG TPA: choice-of-anchor D domain-containing protein, partial [Candidatus Cloacimonas acidaminovorans]|nr:choice-of-anchor D domain-containing protein [Candidatus Cloacimonas acidaminovorans]